MAKVVKRMFVTYIKLDSGKVIKPLDGGWYDGRQYYKGELGELGVIIVDQRVGARRINKK